MDARIIRMVAHGSPDTPPGGEMHEIIPGLFLGSWGAAYNVPELKRVGVTHILTALQDDPFPRPEGFARLHVPLDDYAEEDLLSALPASVEFIEGALNSGGKVLVHCQAGISRSASIVAAYLIASQKLTRATAVELIKKKRPGIRPNDGFLKQLDTFHSARCIISVDDKTTRLHYIEKTVRLNQAGEGVQLEREMLASVPKRPTGRRIRCKMCRQELATREHMFPHGQSASTPAGSPSHPAARDVSGPAGVHPSATTLASDEPLLKPTCSGYFLEPMEWMQKTLDEGNVEGKITCPNVKCGAKLGNFAWAG
ncbi:phosphatases II, partial [Auricularia subglabra TFB-10046 SS5]